MKILFNLDPRRSLAAAAIWLIIGLAMTFSLTAAVWVGHIARKNVLEQHVRRLSLETDQLGTDLSQALAARLDAVRSTAALSRADGGAPVDVLHVFEKLEAAYPHLGWLSAADTRGVIVASRVPQPDDAPENPQAWALAGLRGLWLYVGGSDSRASSPSSTTVTELGMWPFLCTMT